MQKFAQHVFHVKPVISTTTLKSSRLSSINSIRVLVALPRALTISGLSRSTPPLACRCAHHLQNFRAAHPPRLQRRSLSLSSLPPQRAHTGFNVAQEGQSQGQDQGLCKEYTAAPIQTPLDPVMASRAGQYVCALVFPLTSPRGKCPDITRSWAQLLAQG